MAKLPFSLEQQKPVLIGGAAAVGFSLWLGSFFIPQFSNWIQRGPQVQALKNQVEEGHRKLEHSAQREKEFKDLKAQSELGAAALLPQQQLPELMDKIALAAQSAGVSLEVVKPKLEMGQLLPGPSGYLELPLEVHAVGSYHALGLFLDTLERSDSLIRVQEFKIQSDPKDIWNHQATLVLQSYLFPGGKSQAQ